MDDNTTVVIIIALVFGIEAIHRHFKSKDSMQKQSATKQQLETEIEQLKANQQQLIDRIQTLETIVTDDGYQLKQQVKAL